MRGWWIPWTFPVALLAVVVIFAVFGDYAMFVISGVTAVLVPFLWRAYKPIEDPDAVVNYWRFKAPPRP